MGIFEAIILGIVQGLTEFLPISSSAHLRIVGDLFPGLGDPGVTFTAVTQIGTEAAVILYFWKDIVRIIHAWFRALPFGPWKNQVPQTDPDVRLGWIVIFGTLPIVILGLLLEDAIDSVFRNMFITAAMLAIFAIFLGIADRISTRRLAIEQMSIRDGVVLGFAQSMALIPGVSRSGGTITVGLLLGYTRSAAARVSFLLAIPAVLGSGFYRFISDDGTGPQVALAPLLIATLVAFIVGYAVIVWFLRLVETMSYMPFVIYRLILALAVVVLLTQGLLNVY
ncbi:undecaprenyl-diphosphate phosphatase [Arcanobacterium phocisimile]|uniref:Undecaprenyl-diphosphatase n=1 Tax=Arcanobacterium phocisimile TaxID=1302235 RepID=A0ABX7IEL7_9ACTO|nr:undecaprenyl-diphosphate phosphatase [Arcanobacterium phocisimile]QRV01411.1 undecaprenyl-diphosphate phosphatase [Arcanobacterium phocisimile]